MKHTAHILFFDNQQLTLQFPFGDILVQFRVEWPDSRQDGLLAISSTAGYQSRGGEEGKPQSQRGHQEERKFEKTPANLKTRDCLLDNQPGDEKKEKVRRGKRR